MTRRAVASALAAFVLGGACGGSRSAAPAKTPVAEGERWSGDLSPPPRDKSGDAALVVAEVNDSRIFVADVERQARLRGIPAKQALDELIEFELLAQEARRRGLADHPDVAAARKTERVRALIDLQFAPGISELNQVPQEYVDKFWAKDSYRSYYQHEEYHSVIFARVAVDEKLKGTPGDQAGQALAEAIYADVVRAHPATKDAFAEAARASAAAHGTKVEVSEFSTTSNTAKQQRADVDFAKAAFTLHTPGEIAHPVRTKWGWDVLYLTEVLPARDVSEAEAAPEIKKNLFPIAQRMEFAKWVDTLVAGAHVQRHDDRLDRVDVVSPLGQPGAPGGAGLPGPPGPAGPAGGGR